MIALAKKELADALRNRWLLGYAALLAVLGLATAWIGLDAATGISLQVFGRTTASLMNLCLLLSPLVALSLGAGAVAGEADRGTLEMLLAQPIARWELLLGKALGLLAALAAATFAGFLPAGLVLAVVAGPGALGSFLLFPFLASVLAAAMLGLGLLISVVSKSAPQAQSLAIFAWFALVLLYDLLLLGALGLGGLPTGALAALLVANPVDAARVLTVLALEPDLYLLGPAGSLLTDSLGGAGAAALLAGALLAWAVLPLAAALRSFARGGPRPARRSARAATRAVAAAPAASVPLELPRPAAGPPAAAGRTTIPLTTRRTAMKAALAVLAAVAALVLFAACSAEGPGAAAAAEAEPGTTVVTAAMLDQGRATYMANCAPCHGTAGKGDGPGAANLDPKPRDHTDPDYMSTLSDEQIAKTVQYGGAISGKPQMPSAPHIRGAELESLVAFVRSLSEPTNERVALVAAGG
ncbi:MAG TPA: ABC transporter permease subunit [Thermoanaerobaculia bacterium]